MRARHHHCTWKSGNELKIFLSSHLGPIEHVQGLHDFLRRLICLLTMHLSIVQRFAVSLGERRIVVSIEKEQNGQNVRRRPVRGIDCPVDLRDETGSDGNQPLVEFIVGNFLDLLSVVPVINFECLRRLDQFNQRRVGQMVERPENVGLLCRERCR